MGELLKNIREINKKTQLEVSKFLNIPLSTYNNYEKNRCEPNLDVIIKLANYYDVPLDYLVGRTYNNEFGYLDAQEKAMLKTFRALSENGKTKVASYSLGILAMEN